MVDLRGEANWSVYLHIIPKEINDYDYDKYYVGITQKTVEDRWETNGTGYSLCGNKKAFGYAVRKYGWDNIEHEVLASNITADEAKDFERAMIKALKSHGKYGYNLTDGGDGVLGMTPSTIKKVFQFDTNGKYLGNYISENEAARQNNVSASGICLYVNGKRSLTGATKYIWAYEQDVIWTGNTYKLKDESILHFDIYQFDLQGNYIDRYASIAAAAKANNLDYDALYNQTRNCSRRKSNGDNYLWRKAENVYYANGTYHMIEKEFSGAREVFQFTDKGTFVAKYDSINDAASKTLLKPPTLRARAAYRTNNVKDGMVFRFIDDVQELENGSFLMLR